jgi:hypothetical protein
MRLSVSDSGRDSSRRRKTFLLLLGAILVVVSCGLLASFLRQESGETIHAPRVDAAPVELPAATGEVHARVAASASAQDTGDESVPSVVTVRVRVVADDSGEPVPGARVWGRLVERVIADDVKFCQPIDVQPRIGVADEHGKCVVRWEIRPSFGHVLVDIDAP